VEYPELRTSLEAFVRVGEDVVRYLAIAAGAVLGANARYLVTLFAVERLGLSFPYGTLFVNISGSLVAGLFLTLALERLAVPPIGRLFFATGFLGAYTTFSAYTYETAALVREGAYVLALLYLVGSIVGGMIGVFAGIMVAESL
jgi:CrcB protein